jgi:hypothetical protein
MSLCFVAFGTTTLYCKLKYLKYTTHQQCGAYPINDIYIWSASVSEFPFIWILICVAIGISISSPSNTDLSNCRPYRMFHIYFHLFISLQPSRIFQKRRQRKARCLSRGSKSWMPSFVGSALYLMYICSIAEVRSLIIYFFNCWGEISRQVFCYLLCVAPL